MTSQNFDHLKDIDRPLAILATHAEKYFVDDANTALIKTRQFAERMTRVIAESAGADISSSATFSDMLRSIRRDDLVPAEILDILHRLRIDGNAAVHGHDGERRMAFEAIKLCHRLGVWLRASATRQPRLTMPFIPPRLSEGDAPDLKEQVAVLRSELEARSAEAARLADEAESARSAALDAEDRARLAEEERAIYAELAEEAERQATKPVERVKAKMFIKAAFDSAKDMDFDEADTRLLVDEQLRQAGWDVDSATLRHSKGTRPEKNRNMAIAEWPTSSGPADYALFTGRTLVGLVEAKRKRKNVMSAVDVQATRYSQDIQPEESFDFARWTLEWPQGPLHLRHQWAEFLSGDGDAERDLVPGYARRNECIPGLGRMVHAQGAHRTA